MLPPTAPEARTAATPPKTLSRAAIVPVSRLVGQRLICAFEGTTPSTALLARIERGEVGGVILFRDNVTGPRQLADLVSQLQNAAAKGHNPGLLIATDQEGGAVRRLPYAPPYQSALQMGSYTPQRVTEIGADTGKALKRAGITVDLAPVLDTPVSPSSFLSQYQRAFSGDSKVVASVGPAFVRGIQSQRVAATAKHFPGLGTASADTDQATVVVPTSRRELVQRLIPFHAAIRAGVQLVMVSSAEYPALDPSRHPALMSGPIIKNLLRRQLGFRGVVLTDTMSAPAVANVANAPVLALEAGVDVLLYTSEAASATAYSKLLGAARAGLLTRTALEASYERVLTLKRWLGLAKEE
jgi:beta-N-acetylhexosaminidase